VEKVVYVLWRRDEDSADGLLEELLGETAPRLLSLGARGVQVNVADSRVADALIKVATLDPPIDAVVSVWLDTVMDAARAPIDAAVAAVAKRMAAYLVTESVPLPNTTHIPPLGERTDGFANIAFLRRPDRFTPDEWLAAWQNVQTPVAIATQSTFGYTQNVVVRPLTPDAPPFAGIVEELFPPEALTDLHAFFDAVGDDVRLQTHMTAMNESTERFGATETIDVVPTSQYVITPPFPL
jgi:hypothetical protein